MSGGVAISALTIACTSLPATGRIGKPRFSASTSSAGSDNVVSNALRRAATRSAGTPGGVTVGKPMPESLDTKRNMSRSMSFFARLIISGTLGKSGSGARPIWSRMLIFLSAIHAGQLALRPDHTTEARPSTSPRSMASWIVLPP